MIHLYSQVQYLVHGYSTINALKFITTPLITPSTLQNKYLLMRYIHHAKGVPRSDIWYSTTWCVVDTSAAERCQRISFHYTEFLIHHDWDMISFYQVLHSSITAKFAIPLFIRAKVECFSTHFDDVFLLLVRFTHDERKVVSIEYKTEQVGRRNQRVVSAGFSWRVEGTRGAAKSTRVQRVQQRCCEAGWSKSDAIPT